MALESEPDYSAVDPLPSTSPSRRPYTPLLPTFHKATARIVSFAGQRNLAAVCCPVIASYDTITNYDSEVCPGVAGLVALTIDDSPCRQSASACMVTQVVDLLSEFGAQATFMVTAEFVAGKEEDMVKVLMDGHEIANHCWHEAPCINLEEEEFEKQLMDCEAVCEDLRQRAVECKRQQVVRHPEVDVPVARPVEPESEPERTREAAEKAKEVADQPIRWFRAPSALCNSTMLGVLRRRGFTHVLGDCYANDPFVTDPEFLAGVMLENVMDGSVLVTHIPERGFREYNLEALRLVLQGLQSRGLKAVTMSALHAASMKQAEFKETDSSMFSNLLPDIVSPDRPARHLHRSSNIFKGTMNAAISVTRGAVTGAAGLVIKPYEGACQGGMAGFASGVGEGLVGMVTKPVDGVLDGGTQIIGGVAGTMCNVPRAVLNSVGISK
mmetsp:Transcript_26083/g.45401  ORF Transcript_26083/g.45401 Transcript_26083/m.45401 type:complete len:440 (-) Transcript_26083:116-1435(-)